MYCATQKYCCGSLVLTYSAVIVYISWNLCGEGKQERSNTSLFNLNKYTKIYGNNNPFGIRKKRFYSHVLNAIHFNVYGPKVCVFPLAPKLICLSSNPGITALCGGIWEVRWSREGGAPMMRISGPVRGDPELSLL